MFKAKITGVDETLGRVMEFPKKLQRKWLMKAARAGAKPVKAAMIRNAPQDKNATPKNTWRKSVGTKVKMKRRGTGVFFLVGSRATYGATVTIISRVHRKKRSVLRIPRLYTGKLEKKYRTVANTHSQTESACANAIKSVLEDASQDV